MNRTKKNKNSENDTKEEKEEEGENNPSEQKEEILPNDDKKNKNSISNKKNSNLNYEQEAARNKYSKYSKIEEDDFFIVE